MFIRLFIVSITAVILSGCLSDDGQKFVGNWQNTKHTNEKVIIEKNDNNYLITVVRNTCFRANDCMDETNKYPATLEKNMLVIRNGDDQINVVIEDKTGELLVRNTSYKKISNSNS